MKVWIEFDGQDSYAKHVWATQEQALTSDPGGHVTLEYEVEFPGDTPVRADDEISLTYLTAWLGEIEGLEDAVGYLQDEGLEMLREYRGCMPTVNEMKGSGTTPDRCTGDVHVTPHVGCVLR